MNQCSQPSWSKLNTAAMLHDVFSVTKTHYVLNYVAKKMMPKSRMITYFNTLDNNVQEEVLIRVDELVKEEQEYCDKGNYEHMCNILCLLAIYEVLQKHGMSEEEAFTTVGSEMHKFVQPYKEKFQKLSK